MTEYKVISANWIEVAEGYGYWDYKFERSNNDGFRYLHSAQEEG